MKHTLGIDVIHPNPGDVVVATIDLEAIGADRAETIILSLTETFPGHTCVVLDSRVKLELVSRERLQEIIDEPTGGSEGA